VGQVGTSGTGTSSIVGTELVPGQGKASSYEQGEAYFDLSQSQLGQAVLVPLGQAQFHLDKHSLYLSACPIGTGCACPNGLSQWHKKGTGTTLQMSNEEEPAPSAHRSEIGNDDAGSDIRKLRLHIHVG